jgi:hypothetical protein
MRQKRKRKRGRPPAWKKENTNDVIKRSVLCLVSCAHGNKNKKGEREKKVRREEEKWTDPFALNRSPHSDPWKFE